MTCNIYQIRAAGPFQGEVDYEVSVSKGDVVLYLIMVTAGALSLSLYSERLMH